MGVEEGAGSPGSGDQHELRQEVGKKTPSFRGFQELSVAGMKSLCDWWGGGLRQGRQGRQAGVRSSALTSEAQVMWKDLKWETGEVRLEERHLRDREGSANYFSQESATARAKQGPWKWGVVSVGLQWSEGVRVREGTELGDETAGEETEAQERQEPEDTQRISSE